MTNSYYARGWLALSLGLITVLMLSCTLTGLVMLFTGVRGTAQDATVAYGIILGSLIVCDFALSMSVFLILYPRSSSSIGGTRSSQD